MAGLETNIVVHKLPLKEKWKLVKQKIRQMHLEICFKIKEEVKK